MIAHVRAAHPRLLNPRPLAPSPGAVAVAAVVLAVADWGNLLAGGTAFSAGPLDEIAHLLTTLLVFWALGSRMRERFMVPALIASVVIDADHIPDRLGVNWLTAGTPRPYTHSLSMIVVVLVAAALWRRRRDLLLGVAIGLAIHFVRDMGEGGSGVAMLWPFSYHSFAYPNGVFIAAMAVVAALDATLCMRDGRRRRMRPKPSSGGTMSRLIRMDQSGHTTLAEWNAEDPASIEAAVAAFRAELDEGYFAVVSEGEGRAEQVRELPVDAPLVILRRPIAGG